MSAALVARDGDLQRPESPAVLVELRRALDAYECGLESAKSTVARRRALADAVAAAATWVSLAPAVAAATADVPGPAECDARRPVPRPLSQAEVDAQLASFVRSEPASRPPTACERATRERQIVRHLLDLIGNATDLSVDDSIGDELDRLDRATDRRARDRWRALELPRPRAWLTFLAARLRAIREHVAPEPSLCARHRDLIRRLPQFASSIEGLPHVNGLARRHEPVDGSWEADARAAYGELESFVRRAGQAERVEPRAKATTRRRSRQDGQSAAEWLHRNAVASMRVLMFGGSPREDARANLERVLGIGTLSWRAGAKPRRLAATVESIRRGAYDLVLVNRFVHHVESEAVLAAARSSETPGRMIDSYRVETVKSAISELLGGGGVSGA